MIGTALTAIIGLVAKGKAAKAIASGASAVVTIPIIEPLMNEFMDGILAGAGPEAKRLGTLIGATVVAGIFQYATTWFAPANAPAKKG